MRALLFVLVLVALPRVADADRIKVAVVPGIAVNVDAARVDALSQDLADALATELDIDAVGGLAVRRQLPAEGLPPDCVANPSCIADVAKRVSATQLLFVVMIDTGSGGAVQIDSTWIEPATGKSTSRPAIDVAPGADARSRFIAAAKQLLPDAPVRPKPAGGKMIPAVPRHITRPSMLTAAAAVVGTGVGIGFGLSARSKFKKCDVDPTLVPSFCDDGYRGSIRNRALIADIGFAVGIAGAIGTGVLIAISGEKSRMVIETSPTGVTAAVVGRF